MGKGAERLTQFGRAALRNSLTPRLHHLQVRNARQKEHFETARKRVLEAKALDAKLDAAEEAVDAQERAEGKAMDAKIRAEFEASAAA